MKYLVLFFMFSVSMFGQDLNQAQHSGFDFTSYLVHDVHQEGKKRKY